MSEAVEPTAPIDPLLPENLAKLKTLKLDIQLVALPVAQLQEIVGLIQLLASEIEKLREGRAHVWDEGYEVRHIGHSCINPYSMKAASPRAVDDPEIIEAEKRAFAAGRGKYTPVDMP